MLKMFLSYYKPYWRIVLFVIVGSCATAGLDLIFPAVVRQIMNVELPEQNTDRICLYAAVLLVMYIANSMLLYGLNYHGRKMGVKIEADMRQDLFAHIERLSIRFFDETKTGQLLSRLTSDLTEVGELVFRGPLDLLICLLSMVGTLVILFWMNPMLGSLIAVCLLSKTIHTVIINQRMKRAFRANRVKVGDVAAKAAESLSGIRLIKAFACEQSELNALMKKNDECVAARCESYKLSSYYTSSMNFFTNFTNLAVLVGGTLFINAGQMTISDLVAYFLYVNLFMKPLLRLTILAELYQRGMAGFSRFYELMKTEPEIVDLPESINVKKLRGDIVFDNVSFGYGKGREVLRKLSFCVKAGETVAFVGATGAGKTTLANLLLRFYEPDSGRILIDGIDIRAYQQQALRRNIGLVQQDVFLFSDSIRANLTYGVSPANENIIQQAAQDAMANEFIEKLPERYDTCVGERGVKLSGGQKQRIAIARVFIKNPPIVIMDEATSALDNKTEQQVKQSLHRLAKNRTTILIAHRLSSIQQADRIFVLKDGAVIEEGTHEELLAAKGCYRELYDSQ